ncbi:MAG: DUF1294 domain-containing protein [Lachnospiraceae bacterium]|nr:DUF1294 domain-containing protein [Lachnospiraceae bacterium]
MLKYIIIYFILVNFIAFLMYGMDKKKAIDGKYRIAERTLVLIGVIGGSIGAMAGMKVFHHKTKHKKFVYGLPLIFMLQCFFVCLLWKTMT